MQARQVCTSSVPNIVRKSNRDWEQHIVVVMVALIADALIYHVLYSHHSFFGFVAQTPSFVVAANDIARVTFHLLGEVAATGITTSE